MKQIICRDVSLGYDDRAILSGLSFDVSEGDYLCIVGENGAGKSTLMKTLLGLKKPYAGSVEFAGDVSRRDIGYLPQQTTVQKDFPASVREVVLSGFQGKTGLRPFYSREEKAAAAREAERMGITDLMNRCYRELSGGQQQRVLLARALCAAGKIILLDEPVSGLDPKVTAEMYRLIKSLNDEGITVIMISHDISAAVQYASHILHIGKEIFFGTISEYRESAVGKKYLTE